MYSVNPATNIAKFATQEQKYNSEVQESTAPMLKGGKLFAGNAVGQELCKLLENIVVEVRCVLHGEARFIAVWTTSNNDFDVYISAQIEGVID